MSSLNQIVADPQRSMRQMIKAAMAELWVCLPCTVESYDAEAVTITAQPSIIIPIRLPDGTLSLDPMPLLVDVPVIFTRGGGVSITHPINQGDECLVIFADRCIDAWWQNGGEQLATDNRRHDLSDGFAIFAPQSQAHKLQNISPDKLQIRTDDGQAYIELNPATHAIKAQTIGDIELQAPTIKLVGNVDIQGNVSTTGTLTNNGKSVGSTHTHSASGSGMPN